MKKWNKILAVAIVLTTAVSPVASTFSNSKLFVSKASAAETFADSNIAASWAQSAILSVKQQGIMQGDPNGNFRPLDHLTREEFASVLVKALKLNLVDSDATSFHDVQVHSWSHSAIETAFQLGYMKGDGDGIFRPQDPISREEVATILVRALGAETTGLGANLTFGDKAQISDWAQDAVAYMYENGVVKGDGVNFAPQRTAERQEIAVILNNALPLFNGTQTTVTSVTDAGVVLNGVSYTVADSLKGLFTAANAGALQGAKLQFAANDKQLTKVTYLELTNSGKPAESGKPEFSGDLVLDGGNAQVLGNLKISADYISLKNLTVSGNLEVGKELQNDFYANNLKVLGKTVINGGDSNTVVYDNSSLGAVEINKQDVRVEPKGNTTLGDVTVNSNANITADAGVTIPKLTLGDGAEKVELNAGITSLEVKGKNGSAITGAATISNVTLATGGAVTLGTTGEIGKVEVTNKDAKLTVNSNAKIKDLVLPTGVEAKDVVTNYSSAVDNITKVNGTDVKKPDSNGSNPAPTPTPVNHKPVAKQMQERKVKTTETTGFSYSAADLATDADGDTLNFVAGSASASNNGVVEATLSNGKLVITPKAVGHGEVKVRVTDGKLDIQITVSVQVVQEPVLQASLVSGGEFHQNAANVPAVLQLTEKDEEGNAVQNLDLSNLVLKNGNVTLVLGDEYSVNEATDLISLNTSYLNTLTEGVQTLTFTVGGLTVHADLTVLAAVAQNHAPEAKQVAEYKVNVNDIAGKSYGVSDLATDADGDTLQFVQGSVAVINSNVAEAVLQNDQLIVKPKALGATAVTVRVTDGKQETEVSIPVKVVQAEVLNASILYGGQFHENGAEVESVIHLAKLDNAGQLVDNIDLSNLVIQKGAATLTQGAAADYTVDEDADDITLNPSFLNTLTQGKQTLTFTSGDVNVTVELDVLAVDAALNAAIKAVNDAIDIPSTRTAIEAAGLRLQLTPYGYLTGMQRDLVAQAVLDGKGTGYKTRTAIQDVVDLKVAQIQLGGDETTAVQAVNDATTVEEMLGALASPHLHLDNADYSSLEDYERVIVGQYFLDHKGTGFVSRDAIQAAFTDIVTMIIDDWYDIVDDYNATVIGYTAGETKNGVKHDITLPTVGTVHGATIAWTSSNPAVVASNGHVTRPTDKDAVITLTAQLTNRYEHLNKVFQVKVLVLKDSLNAVVTNGSTFVEKSAGADKVLHVSAILNDVAVTDPDLSTLVVKNGTTTLVQDTDYTVDDVNNDVSISEAYLNQLAVGTQTFSLSAGTATGTVDLTVLAMDPALVAAIQAVNDATDVAATRTALEATTLGLQLTPYGYLTGSQRNAVAQKILDGKGTGYLTRAAIQDALDLAVTEIQLGGDETTAVQAVNDAMTVEDMLGALASPYLHLDNADYGSLEDYERDIVANYFITSRGAGFASRDEIQTAFDAIVNMIIDDWYDIVDDVNTLKVTYAAGDSKNSVTQNLTLPTVGATHGATITWTSSNPGVITTDGIVTRPVADTTVKLSALLTNRYEHYAVSLTVTVKGTGAPVAGVTWTINDTAVVQDSYTDANVLNVLAGKTVQDLLSAVAVSNGTVKVYTDSTLQTEAAADAVLTSDMVFVGTDAQGLTVSNNVKVVQSLDNAELAVAKARFSK